MALVFPFIVALTIYFLQKESSKIEYTEIQTRVISEVVNSQCSEYMYVTNLKIENSGSTAIKPADYYSEIVLKIASKSRIIDANLYEKKPSNIPVIITVKDNEIHLSKELLNPQDNYSFSFTSCGERPEFKIQTRISNIDNITKKVPSELSDKTIFLCFHLLILITSVSLILRSLLPRVSGTNKAVILIFITLLFWTKINTLFHMFIGISATFGALTFMKYYLMTQIGGVAMYHLFLSMLSNEDENDD